MKTAVIMAAGMGTRLKEITKEMPKGFLKIGHLPIIEESIQKLLNSGIEKIIIGTGFMAGYYDKLKAVYPVELVLNSYYSETGSMFTLHNMRDRIKDDFLLLESDLIYDKDGLNSLIKSEKKDAILASSLTGFGDEVFIETDKEGFLKNMSKNRNDLASAECELVGITKISVDTFKKMTLCAEKIFKNDRKVDYEKVLVEVSMESLIPVLRLDNYAWCEIDDSEHLKSAKNKVYPAILKNELKTKQVRRNVLLNPGPATTTDSVKYAQVVPDICPREEEFGAMVRDLKKKIVDVVHGEDNYTAVFFAGSGTAIMDSVINSVVPDNGKLLIIANGAYGIRMVKIAGAYKIDHIMLDFGSGGSIDLKKVEDTLSQNTDIKCVAVVHHETTTGILNPIEKIAELKKKYSFSFIVDAISTYAGVPIDLRKTDIDFLLSTSNKCIQGMAGISFAVCKKESLNNTKDYPVRSFYLNLYNQYKHFEDTGQFQFTPPVQTFYALNQAADEYFIEGEEARFDRYNKCWQRYREGLTNLGFKFLHKPEDESKVLLTVMEPDHPSYSFKRMHDYLFERGFTIYPGKIGSKNTFRLSNIGEIYPEDIDNFLNVLKGYLHEEMGQEF